MRGHTEFVKVKRLKHGDIMSIVKWVAEKYPEEFEIIKDEEKGNTPTKKAPTTKKATSPSKSKVTEDK